MARIKIDKFEVIDRTLETLLPEGSEAERAQALHQFARQELKKALDINKAALGQMPDYETRVDGSPSRVESASSRSTIEFEFELANQLYRFVAQLLEDHSPVGVEEDRRPGHPGLYRASHMFFVDGNAANPFGPLPPHEEAVFVNTQPYARKIEGYGNAGQGLSRQAPDGVYQVVAALANDRFANYGDIRFSYRTPYSFGAIHAWANTTSMQSPYRRGEQREEWLRRQPAIVIRL